MQCEHLILTINIKEIVTYETLPPRYVSFEPFRLTSILFNLACHPYDEAILNSEATS